MYAFQMKWFKIFKKQMCNELLLELPFCWSRTVLETDFPLTLKICARTIYNDISAIEIFRIIIVLVFRKWSFTSYTLLTLSMPQFSIIKYNMWSFVLKDNLTSYASTSMFQYQWHSDAKCYSIKVIFRQIVKLSWVQRTCHQPGRYGDDVSANRQLLLYY